MNASDLIYSLKAVKRKAKELPESLRVVAGVASRKIARQSELPEVGCTQPAPLRPYRSGETYLPVSIVTPADDHYMTTFFDIDPLSPSGRYLAVTRLPFIWRVPAPRDPAVVMIVDLVEQTSTVVYRTVGWGAQLGANVQWGADDNTLFCNDVIDGRPVGVRIDVSSLTAQALQGPIYGLTPDRRYSYSGRIDFINAGIPGYGVPDPLFRKPRPTEKQSRTEGIWKTDLETGRSELFLSINDIVSRLPEQESLKGGTYHVFNVKINKQGTRGFVVLFSRCIPGRAGWPPQLVTFDTTGDNIALAIPDRLWRAGGHHPSWLPKGDEIIMNLRPKGKPMEFVRFRADGSGLAVVAPGKVGGGHPSLNPTETHLLTDAYVSERLANEKGEVPIRLIDVARNEEKAICHIYTNAIDGWRRIDPHPVWTDNGRRIFFNGLVNGRRQVLCADSSSLYGS